MLKRKFSVFEKRNDEDADKEEEENKTSKIEKLKGIGKEEWNDTTDDSEIEKINEFKLKEISIGRGIPHVDGNFATIIYIPLKPRKTLQDVTINCAEILEKLFSLQNSLFSSFSFSSPSHNKYFPFFSNENVECQEKIKRKTKQCNNILKENQIKHDLPPIYTYLPIDTLKNKISDNENEYQKEMEEKNHQQSQIHLKKKQEFGLHISLTKTLLLRHHFIQVFLKKIQTLLSTFQRFCLYLTRENVDVFCNENCDRFFASLTFKPSPTNKNVLENCFEHTNTYLYSHLFLLIQSIDNVLKEFDLPNFYEEKKPHLSLSYIQHNLCNILNYLSSNENGNFSKSFTSLDVHTDKIKKVNNNKTHWENVNKLLDDYHQRNITAKSKLNEGKLSEVSCGDDINNSNEYIFFSVKYIYIRIGDKITKINLCKNRYLTNLQSYSINLSDSSSSFSD